MMRTGIAALSLAATLAAPAAAVAQDVIVREPAQSRVIVREPAEQRRVIVQEPAEEKVIVRRPTEVVRRYVVRESRPSVSYERRISVGDTLPEDVTAYDVPDSDYSYTVVNDHRYILDRERRIVDVVD